MFKKLRKFLIAAGVALSVATFLSATSNVSFATQEKNNDSEQKIDVSKTTSKDSEFLEKSDVSNEYSFDKISKSYIHKKILAKDSGFFYKGNDCFLHPGKDLNYSWCFRNYKKENSYNWKIDKDNYSFCIHVDDTELQKSQEEDSKFKIAIVKLNNSEEKEAYNNGNSVQGIDENWHIKREKEKWKNENGEIKETWIDNVGFGNNKKTTIIFDVEVGKMPDGKYDFLICDQQQRILTFLNNIEISHDELENKLKAL